MEEEKERYGESTWVLYWRRFRKHRLAMLGLYVISTVVATALFAPFLAPHHPDEQSPDQRLSPGFWAGNWEYPLGQDRVGRCILSRILYGGRLSLGIGLSAILISGAIGVAVGIISGYYGGTTDLVLMRIVDIMLNFPTLILALALVAALGPGIGKAMLAIGIAYAPWISRVVRGSVLSAKERTYIEAAKAAGAGNLTIMFRHILPNIAGPVIVYVSLSLADGILYTASLGFLGLGAQPPQSEWGTMLGSGRDYLLLGYWWMVTFPGLMILISVLSLNAIGDGLRDAIDPTATIR